MRDHVELPDRTVRHEEPMLELEVATVPACVPEQRGEPLDFIRMNPGANELEGHVLPRIDAVDAIRLLGPLDCVGGDVPRKAAGAAQTLGFAQERLAAAQYGLVRIPLDGDAGQMGEPANQFL